MPSGPRRPLNGQVVRRAEPEMRFVTATALVVVAAAVAASVQGETRRPRCAIEGEPCSLYDASIVELIATPEMFDGKRVRTVGFVHLEFEGNGLYLHKEDWTHSLYRNGLWSTSRREFHAPIAKITMLSWRAPSARAIVVTWARGPVLSRRSPDACRCAEPSNKPLSGPVVGRQESARAGSQ